MNGNNSEQKISAPEKKQAGGWKKFLYLGGVPKKQMLFFTKNLAIMLKAGSTLTEALDVMARQSKGKFAYVLNQVVASVTMGNKFSESLAEHPKVFSEIYVSIIQTGESSGTLSQNLEYLASQLEKTQGLRKKIIGAMTYPAVVLSGSVLLGLGISVFVLPKITKLFKNFKVELPITTRMLIWISDFFQNWGVFAVPGIIFGTIFFIWFLRRGFLNPVTHWIILHIPVVKSLSKHMNLAFFYRNLSILLSSGVTIDDAIKTSNRTVSNYYYKKFILEVYEKIKAGESLGDILKQKRKMFPDTDVQIISVGEHSGSLSEVLSYAADIHEGELDNITKSLSDILEPVLLIFLGLVVGTIALSIITPIYSITQKFK